jgi:uncharacterized protein YabE (DUF348 family)
MTKKIKKLKIILTIVIFLTIFFLIKNLYKNNSRKLDFNSPKIIILHDNGLIFKTKTNAQTIAEFLEEKKIKLTEKDKIIPQKEERLFPQSILTIQRAQKITILVDGEKIETFALSKNIGGSLAENNITLSRLDKTEPSLDFPIQDDLEIVVTRINVEEKIEKEEIDFKTIVKKDSDLGWREKKVTQKGVLGEKEIKYEITYKNGKEISREKLSQEITKEPVEQIETQGTYVKIGKAHRGLGTWYKQPAHLFIGSESGEGLYAANPWLPKGSYVKVTNKANGKSVIVRINDRGPFGPNRIIDLHTTAFKKIASLGAGVIDVKMEEIEN